MPITGEKLDGKKSYKLILPYFTTTAISPEEINSEGERQLKVFYNAVRTFRLILFWPCKIRLGDN